MTPETIAALKAAFRGALEAATPREAGRAATHTGEQAKAGAPAGWLPDALKELESIDEEIAEDELPPVDNAARRALRELGHQPLTPSVYPPPDGEICLSFSAPDKAPETQAVLHVLFGNRGETGWLCAAPGLNAYGRYPNPDALPMDFLRSCLKSLTTGTSPGRMPVAALPLDEEELSEEARRAVKEGMADHAAGRTHSPDDVREELDF